MDCLRDRSKYLVWLMLGLVMNCGSKEANSWEEQTKAITFNEFEHRVKINHAQNFKVTYHGNFKIVDIHYRSSVKEIDFTQKLVLVQKGTPKPTLRDTLKNAWLIEIPIQTVAANEDGEITRLKSLGLIDHIVGMGGGEIYDKELRQRWENKEIVSIGYSFHSIPKPELIIASKADLIVLHTHDSKRLDGMLKLRELGINAVPQFAWAEQNFLAKAEWIKFTSLFYNKEKEATELFHTVETRCEELIGLVDQYPDRVTSFLVYHPSNESDWKAHRNDFYASYLQSVSTHVLQDEGPSHTVGITHEQLLQLAGGADYWFANNPEDKGWPPAEYLNKFKAYQKGQVYHYQKRTYLPHNAYDWYETPQVRPDLVLEDLVSIFYPALMPNHELIFFEKVKLTKQLENK